MKRLLLCGCLMAAPLVAEKKTDIEVRVIDRQESESGYTYFVPGQSTSTSTGNATCTGYGNSANCSGQSQTNTTSIPPRSGGYSVKGATLSLLLPDGRIAVVNCDSKYAPKGDHVNRRSCRVPLVDKFAVEFSGDNAKLKWPTSLDGTKVTSETYKIIGVLDK